MKNQTAAHSNHTLSLIVLLQYVPRFFVIFPLHRRIIKTTGSIAKTAWAGAVYNLLLYILASHVSANIISSLSSSCLVSQYIFGMNPVRDFYYLSLLFSKMSVQIFGASWYLLSIQRQHQCWSIECKNEMNATHSPSCDPLFLDCQSLDKPERLSWLNATKVLTSCDARNDYYFQFGMFADAFTNDVASAIFIEKYFYCLWWGLRSLRYGLPAPTCSITG